MSASPDAATVEVREKRPTPWKGLVFLIVICVAMAGLGAFALTQRPAEGPFVPAEAPDPISVAVQTAQIGESLRIAESFTGLTAARRTSQLGFTNGGRVVSMASDVGDPVAKGQRLAVLDTRALRARLAAAEASVVEARAAHSLAEVTVRRQQELFDKGHVAQQRVDEAVAQADSAYARIDAAKAQADLLRVEIDLAAIRAPFRGVVTDRFMDEGAIAAPGAPVFELSETGAVEARIGLPAAAASRLEPGAMYLLEIGGVQVDAELRALTGVIDSTQRTVTAMFDVDAGVQPGAVARVAVARDVDERGFWIPVGALLESKRGLWSVYVVERGADGRVAAPRLVEIVHSDGGRAYVRGAVKDGEQVIVDGLQRLSPGQPVTPIAAETAAIED